VKVLPAPGELLRRISPPRSCAADGEAEAGAAVLACRAGVRLLERLEDDALLLERDADAGIADGELDDVAALVQ